MKIAKALVTALMVGYACASQASLLFPSSGLWYNPNESGRGFTIDSQNGTMVVSSYVFDQSGKQIWYLSSGTYSFSTGTFNGTFDNATNGQCLGCAYVKPVISVNVGGPIKIVFDSLETGTLYFNGGSTRIQHFKYGYADLKSYFWGEWNFSFSIVPGVLESQWVVFPGTSYTATDGTVYAQGQIDAVPNSAALAEFVPSLNSFLVAINDGVGYISTYQLIGDTQRMGGAGWLEPIGTNISGNGSVAFATRMLSLGELGLLQSLESPDQKTAQALVDALERTKRITADKLNVK